MPPDMQLCFSDTGQLHPAPKLCLLVENWTFTSCFPDLHFRIHYHNTQTVEESDSLTIGSDKSIIYPSYMPICTLRKSLVAVIVPPLRTGCPDQNPKPSFYVHSEIWLGFILYLCDSVQIITTHQYCQYYQTLSCFCCIGYIPQTLLLYYLPGIITDHPFTCFIH